MGVYALVLGVVVVCGAQAVVDGISFHTAQAPPPADLQANSTSPRPSLDLTNLLRTSAVPASLAGISAPTPGVELAVQQRLVVRLPASGFAAHGVLEVPPGVLLMLEGAWDLSGAADGGRQLNSIGSVWRLGGAGAVGVAGNSSAPIIRMAPGSVLHMRNLVLSGASISAVMQPGGSGRSTGPDAMDASPHWLPSLVQLPPDPWAAAVVLRGVLVVLESCTQLQDLQHALCGMQVAGMPAARWPIVEVEPGWAWVQQLHSFSANVTLLDVSLVCSLPLPDGMVRACARGPDVLASTAKALLYGVAQPVSKGPSSAGAQDAGHDAEAAAIQGPAFVSLRRAAGRYQQPENTTQVPHPALSAATVPPLPWATTDGTRPLACAARIVENAYQLGRALTELQRLSVAAVVVQLAANVSLAEAGGSAQALQDDGVVASAGLPDWLSSARDGRSSPMTVISSWSSDDMATALRIYRNVTFVGSQIAPWEGQHGGGWEWDYLQLPHGFHRPARQYVELDLGLATCAFWLQAVCNTTEMRFQGLVVTNLARGPLSEFPSSILVTSWWAVTWDKPLPGDKERMALRTLNCTLVFPHDQLDYNTYWAGIAASRVGSVRDMRDSLPDSQRGVFYGDVGVSPDVHFLYINLVKGSSISYERTIMTDLPFHAPLMLTACGVQQVVPGRPYELYSSYTGVTSGEQLLQLLAAPPTPYLVLLKNVTLSSNTLAAAGQRLQLLQLSSSWSTRTTVTQVTVLGSWEVPTLLDLGGAVGVISLIGTQVTLSRLTLVGLAPAQASAPTAPGLENLTSSVFFFDYSRQRGALTLDNVTLVLPPDEVAAYCQLPAVERTDSSEGSGETGPPTLPPLAPSPFALRQAWSQAVRSAKDPAHTQLLAPALTVNGVKMRNCVLSVTPPPFAAALNATPVPQGLSLIPVPSSAEGPVLASWQIALLAAGCVLCLLLACGMAASPRLRGVLREAWCSCSCTKLHTASFHAGCLHGNTSPGLRWAPSPSSTGSQSTCAHPSGAAHSSADVELCVGRQTGSKACTRSSPRPNASAQAAGPGSEPKGSGQVDPSPHLLHGKATTVLDALKASAHVARAEQTGAATASEQCRPKVAMQPAAATAQDTAAPQTARLHQSPSSAVQQCEGVSGPEEEIRQLVASQSKRLAVADARNMAQSGPMGHHVRAPTVTGTRQVPVVGAKGEASAAVAAAAVSTDAAALAQCPSMVGVVLEEVVGAGSGGVVYRGTWRGMPVAVKALQFQAVGVGGQTARQRAVNEAAVNTLLAHECICNMFAYDLRAMQAAGLPEDGITSTYRLFIIQEYCDGGSLAQAVDAGMFVDPATGEPHLAAALQAAVDVARGLTYIHDRSILHGDVSANNVLLRTERALPPLRARAKVCDFGLAHFLEGPSHSHVSGVRGGTAAYMAPEVVTSGLLSRAADVFSFGMLLWELLHAHTPPWRQSRTTAHSPSSPAALSLCDLSPQSFPRGALPPLPDSTPAPLVALVAACLDPYPKARPRMQEVQEQLEELAAGARLRAATPAAADPNDSTPVAGSAGSAVSAARSQPQPPNSVQTVSAGDAQVGTAPPSGATGSEPWVSAVSSAAGNGWVGSSRTGSPTHHSGAVC